MFGSRDLTTADQAATAAIKRSAKASQAADTARAQREAIEAKRTR